MSEENKAPTVEENKPPTLEQITFRLYQLDMALLEIGKALSKTQKYTEESVKALDKILGVKEGDPRSWH